MKLKASVIFTILFMITIVFSAQNQVQANVKQTGNQQVTSSAQQNSNGKSTRAIINNGSKTNWSKIKDMFM